MASSPHLSEPSNAGSAAPTLPTLPSLLLLLLGKQSDTDAITLCGNRTNRITNGAAVSSSCGDFVTANAPMLPFPRLWLPPQVLGYWPGGTYLPHHRLLLIRDRALPLISFSCASLLCPSRLT